MKWNGGRWIVAAVMLIGAACPAQEFDHTHSLYDGVLKAHVVDGTVDYKALQADRAVLDRYLASVAAVPEKRFKSWDEARQLALLGNLYNAATLQLIIDHYPIKGIREIGGPLSSPWDRRVVRLFGKRITLNNLEHDILRKQYDEPRLHMALVCAAKGCPPLRGEAFTADRLDEQLDDQSRVYLAGPAGLVVDVEKREARVSAIFKWYGGDFESVPAFVSKHSGKNLDGYKIRYLHYDWALNDKSEAGR